MPFGAGHFGDVALTVRNRETANGRPPRDGKLDASRRNRDTRRSAGRVCPASGTRQGFPAPPPAWRNDSSIRTLYIAGRCRAPPQGEHGANLPARTRRRAHRNREFNVSSTSLNCAFSFAQEERFFFEAIIPPSKQITSPYTKLRRFLKQLPIPRNRSSNGWQPSPAAHSPRPSRRPWS